MTTAPCIQNERNAINSECNISRHHSYYLHEHSNTNLQNLHMCINNQLEVMVTLRYSTIRYLSAVSLWFALSTQYALRYFLHLHVEGGWLSVNAVCDGPLHSTVYITNKPLPHPTTKFLH